MCEVTFGYLIPYRQEAFSVCGVGPERYFWRRAALRFHEGSAATAPAHDRTMPPLHTAVCLTGMERSFAEVGANIREGLYHLLGAANAPHAVFVGVRPPHDTWPSVRALLPLDEAHIDVQRRCWGGLAQNLTIRWMHCDMRLRAGDCRLSFLQALCDLERCESLIADAERARGRQFDLVVRIRADLFWENRITLPTSPSPLKSASAVSTPSVADGAASTAAPMIAGLAANTVYVPAMDSQDGVNDHLAFGARDVMRTYLTRMRHISRAGIVSSIKGLGSEGFLGASLLWDRVRVQRLQGWAYCPHTPRNLLRKSASEGCIGRVRCRVACTSLYCPNHGIHAGECECLNVTCAAWASGAPAAVLGVGSPNARKAYEQRRYTRTLKAARDRAVAPRYCSDVGGGLMGTQLFHGCDKPSTMATSTKAPAHAAPTVATVPTAAIAVARPTSRRCATPCTWAEADHQPGLLPSCILPSSRLEPNLTARPRQCAPATYLARFVGTNGGWPWG